MEHLVLLREDGRSPEGSKGWARLGSGTGTSRLPSFWGEVVFELIPFSGEPGEESDRRSSEICSQVQARSLEVATPLWDS